LVEVTDNLEARLTAHLSNTRFEDLPANVVDATKKCILDILGVMCGGSAADGIQPLIEMLQGWSLKPDATVVHGTRLASIHATWVNGAMARAREFDDSHDPTGDHISVPIMPSALGAIELLGEGPGRELIVAYALGADLNARLRMASQQRSGENSFAANTYAPFSAGTVAAKLFGLTGMAMYNTLAWAYTQCAGGLQLQQSGQSALHIHHGLAASTGLQAALLAKQGFAVMVLEADSIVGGISRTARYKDYRFDIGGHHPLAERNVAADQRIDGFDDHALGKTAHFRNQPGQFLQIAVERLRGVFRNHGFLLSRTGR